MPLIRWLSLEVVIERDLSHQTHFILIKTHWNICFEISLFRSCWNINVISVACKISSYKHDCRGFWILVNYMFKIFLQYCMWWGKKTLFLDKAFIMTCYTVFLKALLLQLKVYIEVIMNFLLTFQRKTTLKKWQDHGDEL